MSGGAVLLKNLSVGGLGVGVFDENLRSPYSESEITVWSYYLFMKTHTFKVVVEPTSMLRVTPLGTLIARRSKASEPRFRGAPARKRRGMSRLSYA
jgi:hypothetical protein